MLIFMCSLSRPLWFGERLQLKKQWGGSAGVTISFLSWRDLRNSSWIIKHRSNEKTLVPLRVLPQSLKCHMIVIVCEKTWLETQPEAKAIPLFCPWMFTIAWSVASIWLFISGGSPMKSRDCNPSCLTLVNALIPSALYYHHISGWRMQRGTVENNTGRDVQKWRRGRLERKSSNFLYMVFLHLKGARRNESWRTIEWQKFVRGSNIHIYRKLTTPKSFSEYFYTYKLSPSHTNTHTQIYKSSEGGWSAAGSCCEKHARGIKTALILWDCVCVNM